MYALKIKYCIALINYPITKFTTFKANESATYI